MAHIVEHLPLRQLEARYRASQDATEARHFQAIWPLAQGRTVLETAEVLALVPRWVEQLAARYNACGPAALGDQRRHNGRTASLLTPELLAAPPPRARGGGRTAAAGAGARRGRRTPVAVASAPGGRGRPPDGGGVWSGPKVAAWMAGHLGRA